MIGLFCIVIFALSKYVESFRMFRLYKTLPSFHGLIGSNLQLKIIKNISCSATNWKKFSFSDLDPDTEVLLVSPKDASENQMKYSEVLEKVG